MWELSNNHCCATCCFSGCQAGAASAATKPVQGGMEESSLFPLADNLVCEHWLASLGSPCLAVLVRPDGRCDDYEYDEGRYVSVHGGAAEEDERRFGLGDSIAGAWLNLPSAQRSMNI